MKTKGPLLCSRYKRGENPYVLTSTPSSAYSIALPNFTPASKALPIGAGREVILWTRTSLKLAYVIPPQQPEGGGFIAAGPDTNGIEFCHSYEPPLFWGKRGTLPRVPRTAVIEGLTISDERVGFFTERYKQRLEKRNVHVYFTSRRGPSTGSPLLSAFPAQSVDETRIESFSDDADNPSGFRRPTARYTTMPPAGGWAGGDVFWGIVTGPVGNLFSNRVGNELSGGDYGVSLEGFYDVPPGPPAVGSVTGCGSVESKSKLLDAGSGFYRHLFRNDALISYESPIVNQWAPSFRSYQMSFYLQPWQADDLTYSTTMASWFTATSPYVKTKLCDAEFDSIVSSIATDLEAFFV